jgi:hypothetical protein
LELIKIINNVPSLPYNSNEGNELILHLSSKFINGYLLDLKKGLVYDYNIDIEKLIEFVKEQKSIEMFIKIIHLLIIHIKNEKLTEKIFDILFQNLNKYLTYDIFVEILISKVFLECNKIVTQIGVDFLKSIPISLLERSDNFFNSNNNNIKFTQLKNDFSFIKNFNLRQIMKITLYDKIKKYDFNSKKLNINNLNSNPSSPIINNNLNNNNNSFPNSPQRRSTFSNVFNYFFKKEETTEQTKNLSNEYLKYIDIVNENLLILYNIKEQKTKLKTTTFFTDIVFDQINKFFNYLKGLN